MNKMKMCSKCEVSKPVTEFTKNGNHGDGYYPWCKKCKNAASKAIKDKDREKYKASRKAEYERRRDKVRDWQLRKDFGITLAEYNEILHKQNNVCAICEKVSFTRNGKLTSLHVDHCHKTGKNRALLCNQCNNGLGRFMDNVENLRKAADYIEKYQNQEIKSF